MQALQVGIMKYLTSVSREYAGKLLIELKVKEPN